VLPSYICTQCNINKKDTLIDVCIGGTVCSSRYYRLGVCDEQLQQEVGTNGVDGGDDNV